MASKRRRQPTARQLEAEFNRLLRAELVRREKPPRRKRRKPRRVRHTVQIYDLAIAKRQDPRSPDFAFDIRQWLEASPVLVARLDTIPLRASLTLRMDRELTVGAMGKPERTSRKTVASAAFTPGNLGRLWYEIHALIRAQLAPKESYESQVLLVEALDVTWLAAPKKKKRAKKPTMRKRSIKRKRGQR